MRRIFLIQVAVVTLAPCVSSSAKVESHTFHVLHTPNYGRNASSDHTMGIRFEGNSTIHQLGSNPLDSGLLYTSAVHISIVPRYQYVVLHGDQIIASESFYRHLTTTNSTYDSFNRTTVQQEIPLLLPQIQFNSQTNDYRYPLLKSTEREFIHPSNAIATLHIKTPDMSALTRNLLEDITVMANLTRTINDVHEQFGNVKFELSGQTSRLFRKLSYSIQLDKQHDLRGYRRFKLRSCATDPSYLREKVYYDVLRAAGVPTARASFVRLFINGQPHGLFLMTDNYKNPFLPNTLGGEGSALIQGSMQENPLADAKKLQLGANLEYLGPHVEDYFVGNMSVYKMQETTPKGFEDLVEFIKFIYDTQYWEKGNQKLEQEWEKRMDISLFLKHLALEVLLGHGDGYMGAAHNYMLYQDPNQHGRFIWLFSDLDQTMGNTLKSTHAFHSPFGRLDRYGLFDQTAKRPLVHQLLQVPIFKQRFFRIFSDIHQALFETNALTRHVLSLQKLIEQDVEWDQQLDQFRPDYFASNRTVYDIQVHQKVLQLPLGQDFMDRILNRSISFKQAIEGPIHQHQSIMSLLDWFRETSEYLSNFINSL